MKKFMLVACLLLAACGNNPAAERDKYFKSGQKYLEAKKYDEASIEFRNALRADKGHIPSFLALAETFQKQGNHQNAIQAYQQVVKLDGKNVPAKLRLAEYMLLSAQQKPELYKQAQEMLAEVLKSEPSNAEARILLGNAYAGQKELGQAIEQFKKVLEKDPDNLKGLLNLAAAHFSLQDVLLAEATYNLALQKHPNAVEPHLAVAAFYAAMKKLPEAEVHLKKAFDIEPAGGRSLYMLASFYAAQKKTAEEENVFREAIRRKPSEREPRWGLAAFQLRHGKVDQGVAELNEILKLNKYDRPALLQLAEISLASNKDAEAEGHIKTLLTVNKGDAQAHYLQGMILRKRKELDKAMTEFDAAIKLDATLAPAYLEKANLLLMRGELDACETTLKEALEKNKGFVPARAALAKVLALRQKPEEALTLAGEVLAALPDNEDALMARAESLRRLNRLPESQKDWARLSELQPKNAQYWHRRGTVEAMQAQFGPALEHFRKAVELQPNFTVAINDILFLHLKDKRFDAALAELDRLAKTAAPQDEIHRFRAQVLLAKGDIAGGESELKKTIELNPKNYQTYAQLAQINARRNNLPQAIKEVDQLIATNDKLPAAYLLKATYMDLSKDKAGAMANYRKALALDAENPVAANNLAWILTESGSNLDEALSLARKAKAKAPDDPEIAETLGWTYCKMKNYTLAVDQLEQSIGNRKQPTAEHYYRLGLAYSGKGDAAKAKQTMRKALDLNSKFEGAQEARKILAQ